MVSLVDINNIHGGASKACEWDLMARDTTWEPIGLCVGG